MIPQLNYRLIIVLSLTLVVIFICHANFRGLDGLL
jgi:hypothetical protein